MDLILWRHAQAVMLTDEAGEPLPFELERDLARELTTKGERQAARMAEWLNQRLPASTRVLVSPARRTQQTALALGRRSRTLDALNPLASVDDLLQAARWPDSRDPVLIVGHQPALGLLASRLLTGQEQPWSVRKGAVWWLRSRERDGDEQVVLHAVVPPDLA
nr:histidine phosphatase family protein [uncultured Aquabacterium sp.]